MPVAKEYPAIGFAAHQKLALFHLARMDWLKSAEHMVEVISVQQSVGRRAHIPSAAAQAANCFLLAGEEERAWEMLDVIRKYELEKKKDWPREDTDAFGLAKKMTKSSLDEKNEDGTPKNTMEGFKKDARWDLLRKIVLFKQLVLFMTPDLVDRMLALLEESVPPEDQRSPSDHAWRATFVAAICLQPSGQRTRSRPPRVPSSSSRT